MKPRRAQFLQTLASKLAMVVVVVVVALGAVPRAHALSDPENFQYLSQVFGPGAWFLIAIFDHDSSKPLTPTEEMILEILQGYNKRPIPESAAPVQKSFANYGTLSPIAGTKLSDYCFFAGGAALDPSGKFFYMSGGIGSPGRMCAYRIDPATGAWTPANPPGGIPVAVGTVPRAVAIVPSGRFVYVAGGTTGIVSGFSIDRVTGEPTPLAGSPFATGGLLPVPLVIDRAGRFMYVGQEGGSSDGSIAVFAIDATTGALSHVPGSPFPNVANGGRIAALALSPDGRFLFTGGSSLATWSLNTATGVPTRTVSRGGYYYGLAVDPTGRYLFGVDDGDGLLHGFSIAANGSLSPVGVPQSIGTVTRATTAIASVADLVYAGNYGAGNIYGFRLDPATGSLAPLAGSPHPTPPRPSAFAALANLASVVEVPAGEYVAMTVGVYGGRPPYAWSVVEGAMPPGATLNATTGVFSGVLGAPGTYSFTIRASDSLGASASATKSITVTGTAVATPVTVVEFYNAALDHYFITYAADEIAKLDNGTFKGWARTGLSFSAYTTAAGGTSAVCRIYIPPGKGDGHFFGRDANECNGTMTKNPTFILESNTFLYLYPPSLGNCAAGQVPVYRVFSNRADANHRYTTSRMVRDQMVAKGWLAEGDGADTVVMCAPG